jgi:hypothetical protein
MRLKADGCPVYFYLQVEDYLKRAGFRVDARVLGQLFCVRSAAV